MVCSASVLEKNGSTKYHTCISKENSLKKKNSLSKKFNLFFRFSILPFAIRYKCNRVTIYTYTWRQTYQLQKYQSYWLYYYWRIDCSAFNLFCTIQCHPLPKFLFWICKVRNKYSFSNKLSSHAKVLYVTVEFLKFFFVKIKVHSNYKISNLLRVTLYCLQISLSLWKWRLLRGFQNKVKPPVLIILI